MWTGDAALLWFQFWIPAGDKWIPFCNGQPVADYSSAADKDCWDVDIATFVATDETYLRRRNDRN